MGLFDNPLKAVTNVAQGAVKIVENTANEAVKAVGNTGKELEKGVQNVGKEVEKGVQNTGKEIEIGAQNVGKETEIGVQNIGNSIEKAGQDIGKTLGKAGNDTVAQVGRSYGDIVQLAETSYHFAENQVDGMAKSIADASKRIQEGKVVDAVWHVMTDPAKVTEQAAADAVMESSLLNSIAAAGAAAYGGPAGAAAYAAWYTYKATGNLEAALKAGAIAWATSAAGKAASNIDGTTFDAQAKRTLATAAIGGASVAASGGSDEQVLAAFGRSAVVGAAREIYADVTKQHIDGKGPTKPPVLKNHDSVRVFSSYKTLPNGELDITSMPRDISHVGIATAVDDPAYFGITETAGLMQDLAQLPYMNDMAYFHDQWVAITKMEGIAVQATILPAIALTGAASDPALTQPSTETIVEEKKKE